MNARLDLFEASGFGAFPTAADISRLIPHLDTVKDLRAELQTLTNDRSCEIEAAAWASCFGPAAKGSARVRQRRALRVASTLAMIAILNDEVP